MGSRLLWFHHVLLLFLLFLVLVQSQKPLMHTGASLCGFRISHFRVQKFLSELAGLVYFYIFCGTCMSLGAWFSRIHPVRRVCKGIQYIDYIYRFLATLISTYCNIPVKKLFKVSLSRYSWACILKIKGI